MMAIMAIVVIVGVALIIVMRRVNYSLAFANWPRYVLVKTLVARKTGCIPTPFT